MLLATLFDWAHDYLAQHFLLSPLIYICLHVLFALFFVPCSPMTVLAGVLWGKWMGLAVSVVAAFFSSCATFWVSRRFLRKRVYEFLCKRYAKTDWFLAQTKKHGWKFVASVQLNPAAPGSILGYLFGLTGIEFSVYAIFVILFMLPLQILLVVLGDSFSKTFLGEMSWIVMGSILLMIAGYYGYKRIHKKNRVEQ